MDDITGQISKILSDPNSMAQIQNIMGSLGLGGQGSAQTPAPAQAPAHTPAPAPVKASPPAPAAAPAPDLSALTGLLGGNGGGTPDLSALAGLLGGGNSNSNSSNTSNASPLAGLLGGGGTPNLSALSGLLGGGGAQGTEMISTLARLAPLLGKIKEEDNSSRLLFALKPMLSVARQQKIDEAMRILQLMRLFPLLKDSGILSSLLGGLF